MSYSNEQNLNKPPFVIDRRAFLEGLGLYPLTTILPTPKVESSQSPAAPLSKSSLEVARAGILYISKVPKTNRKEIHGSSFLVGLYQKLGQEHVASFADLTSSERAKVISSLKDQLLASQYDAEQRTIELKLELARDLIDIESRSSEEKRTADLIRLFRKEVSENEATRLLVNDPLRNALRKESELYLHDYRTKLEEIASNVEYGFERSYSTGIKLNYAKATAEQPNLPNTDQIHFPKSTNPPDRPPESKWNICFTNLSIANRIKDALRLALYDYIIDDPFSRGSLKCMELFFILENDVCLVNQQHLQDLLLIVNAEKPNEACLLKETLSNPRQKLAANVLLSSCAELKTKDTPSTGSAKQKKRDFDRSITILCSRVIDSKTLTIDDHPVSNVEQLLTIRDQYHQSDALKLMLLEIFDANEVDFLELCRDYHEQIIDWVNNPDYRFDSGL